VRSLGFLVLVACGSAASELPRNTARDHRPTGVAATLEVMAKAIEACGATTLPANTGFVVEPIGTRWKVRATGGGPTIAGKDFVVDLAAATCDGKPIELIAGGTGATPIATILTRAGACAHGPPWNGVGEGGSALVWDRPRIYRQDRIAVEYDEVTPHTKPQGAELWVDMATGICTVVPRE